MVFLLLTNCGASNGEPGGTFPGDTPTDSFVAEELLRSDAVVVGIKPDDYRTTFALFRVGVDTKPAGEYRIGARLSTTNAPTARELVNATAAITRTLSLTPINIYLPFHIDGIFFNPGATQDYDTATATALSPGVSYKIYITSADGTSEVEEILEIITDIAPILTGGELYGFPASGDRYTWRKGEPIFLFGNSVNDILFYYVIPIGWEEGLSLAQCDFINCSTINNVNLFYETISKTLISGKLLEAAELHYMEGDSRFQGGDDFSIHISNGVDGITTPITLQATPTQ